MNHFGLLIYLWENLYKEMKAKWMMDKDKRGEIVSEKEPVNVICCLDIMKEKGRSLSERKRGLMSNLNIIGVHNNFSVFSRHV